MTKGYKKYRETPTTVVKRLSGANYLAIHEHSNIKILLLGEVHIEEGCHNCHKDNDDCYKIDEYINTIIRNDKHNTHIDFFKENALPYIVKRGTERSLFHLGTQQGGSNDHQTLKASDYYWRDNKSQNIRIHNWDLRKLIELYPEVADYASVNFTEHRHPNMFILYVDRIMNHLITQDQPIAIKTPLNLIGLFHEVFPTSDSLNKITITDDPSIQVSKWFATNNKNLRRYLKCICEYVWGDNLDVLVATTSHTSHTTRTIVDRLDSALNNSLANPFNINIKNLEIDYSKKALKYSIKTTRVAFNICGLKYNKHFNYILKQLYIIYWTDMILKNIKDGMLHEITQIPMGFKYDFKYIVDLHMIELFSLPVCDMYLLCKMFTLIPDASDTNPVNIIVYGGVNHIKLINSVLQSPPIFNKPPTTKIEQESNASGKCIEFANYKLVKLRLF